MAYKHDDGFNIAELRNFKYVSAQYFKLNGVNFYRGESPYPVTPSVGDIWEEYSSTTRVERWYWNGTYWLSEPRESRMFVTALNATTTDYFLSVDVSTVNIFLDNLYLPYSVNGTSDATRFWNATLLRANTSLALTTLGTVNTNTGTVGTKTLNLNLHDNVVTNNTLTYVIRLAKSSSPGTLTTAPILNYRKARR